MEHRTVLEYLVYHLHEVKENRKDILWIMKEGIYTPDNQMLEFPDIIVVKRNKTAIPIELKTGFFNRQARPKAVRQLESGRDFIDCQLKRECPYGKIVYTTRRGGLEYETVSFA